MLTTNQIHEFYFLSKRNLERVTDPQLEARLKNNLVILSWQF